MTPPRFSRNDLFFHYVHGLYRLVTIAKPYSKEEEIIYTLLPVEPSKVMMKFHISENCFDDSGFNAMISVREAQRVLDFLGGKKIKPREQSRVWKLAQSILEVNSASNIPETPKMRKDIERSLKSLIYQLGFILNLPVRKITNQVQDALSQSFEISPRLARFLGSLNELKSNPNL